MIISKKSEKDVVEKKKLNVTQDRVIKKKNTTKFAFSAKKLVRNASKKIKDNEITNRKNRIKVQKTFVENLKEKLIKNFDDEKMQTDLKNAQKTFKVKKIVLKNHNINYETNADQLNFDNFIFVKRQSSSNAEKQI